MAAENPFTQIELDRWYNDACKWLMLRHQIYDTRLKNLMERFVQQQIKDRTGNCILEIALR
jgi:hypothetical protein